MKEIAVRFLIGGSLVCVFAALADIFQPKSFAGLFGAAPSVALATLALTVATGGSATAALEARSMIGGAVALFIYTSWVAWASSKLRVRTLLLASASVGIWLAVAAGCGWFVVGRGG